MATRADTKKWQPTEAQAHAYESIDRSMAVDAAAGSGKTAVLIRRICRIVGADPDKPGCTGRWHKLDGVLAITFTEKAAGELRAKLRPYVPLDERYRLDNAWIGTFHSFCSRLIKRHAPLIGLDPSFSILDENPAGLEMRKCVRQTLLSLLEQKDEHASCLVDALEFKTAVAVLEELMKFRWHASFALKDVSGDEWEKDALCALASVFHLVYKNYLEVLSNLGALDFQELEIRALNLLDDKNIKALCQKTFSHILVDEYQDTNDIQTELVKRLFNPELNKLFIVGDKAQSIYRFRGANVKCFKEMRDEIACAGGETIRLAKNFRSRADIISFVNLCQKDLAKPMEAWRSDAYPAPSVIELAINSDGNATAPRLRQKEADAIAHLILDFIKQAHASYGDIVCLFKALTAVEPYEAALARIGIPYRVSGGRGLLLRQEIIDLISALRWAHDKNDRMAMLGLLRSPIIGLSDDDLAVMAGPDGCDLYKNVLSDPRCALIKELPEMALHMRPSEIMRRVINDTGYEYICGSLDPSGAMFANVDRLMTVARNIEREVPTPLHDFVGFLKEMRAQSARLGDPPASDIKNAVRLMTVHAAKGLEFPIVILPDLFHGSSKASGKWVFSRGKGVAFTKKDPLKPFGERIKTERFKKLVEHESDEEMLESQRLLYVAMTRAMNTLVLAIHDGLKKIGTWHEWVGNALKNKKGGTKRIEIETVDTPPCKNLSDTFCVLDAAAKGRMHKRLAPFTVTELESYDLCPMQYYLKYVLGLPSSSITGEQEEIERNIFGSIVHATLSHAMDDENELSQIIRGECLAHGVSFDARMTDKALREVRKAIDLAGRNEIHLGMREMPFEWQIADATVSGSIDWLRPERDGFCVIDFKTGNADPKQYDLQLKAYALAAEAITDKKVISTNLIFAGAGRTLRVAMTDKRRHEGQKRIAQIIEAIGKQDYNVKK
ncbi:MAG: ATP-dependent DNA helicase, partial [Pseudomonadota bacterium]